MKIIIPVLILIFHFTFAEAQTETIKVRKSAECHCPSKDTTMVTEVDFVRGSFYEESKTITISGKVSDTISHKPLSNVNIWYVVDGRKKRVISNYKGEFIIMDSTLGVYSFFVSYPCYNLSSFYLPFNKQFQSAKASIYLRPCWIDNQEGKKP